MNVMNVEINLKTLPDETRQHLRKQALKQGKPINQVATELFFTVVNKLAANESPDPTSAKIDQEMIEEAGV